MLERFHLCEVCHIGYTTSAMVAVQGIKYMTYERVLPWHICKECAGKISATLQQTKQSNESSETPKELIESLADKEHESWARWMNYVFDIGATNDDGSFTIPAESVKRWLRQANTDYKDLSEREKQSDRDEVAHILPIIESYVDSRGCNDEAKKDEASDAK